MDVVPIQAYFLPALVSAIALAWGAGKFVDGAVSLSFDLGLSPLVVGIIVMGFGTSLPEFVVSVMSSATGSSALSLGNAYGSNIINIGLVLGLSAVIKPVIVQNHVVHRELPLLLLATAATAVLVIDMELSRTDGLILSFSFVLALLFLVIVSSRNTAAAGKTGFMRKVQDNSGTLQKSIKQLVLGLAMIVACSAVLVWSAKGIAVQLGVSELIVGVVVLALGTSLPELAVVVVAARRGEHQLALGNVIGSNLFNTLAVVGVASAITPYDIDPDLVIRDLPVMFAFTAFLVVIGYRWGRHTGVINKVEGILLMLAFLAYMVGLIY